MEYILIWWFTFSSSEQTLIHSLNPSHLMHLWNYRENCNASFMWKYFEKYLQWTLECEMANFFLKKKILLEYSGNQVLYTYSLFAKEKLTKSHLAVFCNKMFTIGIFFYEDSYFIQVIQFFQKKIWILEIFTIHFHSTSCFWESQLTLWSLLMNRAQLFLLDCLCSTITKCVGWK